MWTVIESLLWWLAVLLLVVGAILVIGFYLKGAWRDRVKYRVQNPPNPDEARFPNTLASQDLRSW